MDYPIQEHIIIRPMSNSIFLATLMEGSRPWTVGGVRVTSTWIIKSGLLTSYWETNFNGQSYRRSYDEITFKRSFRKCKLGLSEIQINLIIKFLLVSYKMNLIITCFLFSNKMSLIINYF